MLATVLKGDLAEQQSIYIMRAFKEMRHYIRRNQQFVTGAEMNLLNARVTEISMQVAGLNDHRIKTDQSIDRIQKSIDTINANFIQKDDYKNFVIYKGQKFEADAAYIDIYQKARKSIYIVDDYVNTKTLQLLSQKKPGVNVILFTENGFGRQGFLTTTVVTDFNNQYPLLTTKHNQDCHDRLIVLDYGFKTEQVFHCGASSKDAGKLMISVLSAVAEIERENIRVQTMEGRIQKAREGKWNGGFAPYGYELKNGKLYINENEAEAIRIIFDRYVNTDMGSTGIAKYLENHGIHKIARQNGKNPLFDAALIRKIIQNPVYCGKIAYGRRKTEKVIGTRNDYHLVPQDDYLLVEGLHDAIVSEEMWEQAQVKAVAQAKRYEHVNREKGEKTHLLSGIVRCPVCGAGMYGNKSIKHRKDGTKYKDFFYYGCKHRNMTRGHKCDYKKQIHEEMLDEAVAEVIKRLVSNKKFADLMKQKINMEVDTSALDQEIAAYEKQLRQCYSNKDAIMSELDSLDYDDKHYKRRKADLDDRLYRTYDKMDEMENLIAEAKAKRRSILADKMSGDNIYKALIFFDKLYEKMSETEKRAFYEKLIKEVQVYEERQPNGQWLKSIEFKLPILGEDMKLSLDNSNSVETVCLLSNRKPDMKIRIDADEITGGIVYG